MKINIHTGTVKDRAVISLQPESSAEWSQMRELIIKAKTSNLLYSEFNNLEEGEQGVSFQAYLK